MTLSIELPDETLARLRAESERRGVSIDDVIAELADQLPAQPAKRRKLALIGAGATKHGITTTMEQALAEGFGRDPV
jgi:hypothetical protein